MPDTKARVPEESCAVSSTDQPANIQELLSSLGAPPFEVCLDWAGQLLNLQANSPNLNYDSSPSTESTENSRLVKDPARDLQSVWSRWFLSTDGELTLGAHQVIASQECGQVEADGSNRSSVKEAACQQMLDPSLIASQVTQLLDWAGAEWDVGADHLCPNVQRRTYLRLASKLQTQPQSVATKQGFKKVDSTSDSSEINRTNSTHPEIAYSSSPVQTRAEGENRRLKGARRTARSKQKRDVSRKKLKRKPSRVWHFVLGMALPCLVLGFVLYFRKPGNVETSKLSTLDSTVVLESRNNAERENKQAAYDQTSDVRQAQVSNADELSGSTPETLLTIDQLVEGSEGQKIADTLTVLPDSAPTTVDSVVNSLREQLNTSNRPGSVTRQESNSIGDPNNVDQETSIEPPSEDANMMASMPSEAELDSRELLENVVNELSRGNLSDELLVRELPVDSESIENKTIPAQLISTSALMQVQKFPNSFRAKEPSWEVSLRPSEQFSIEPTGPQKLQGKTIASWTLLPVEMKQRKSDELVRVLVQAQLAGRRPDIRWKITAGANELPWLVVPLNAERLEMMLAQVAELQTRTTTAIEMLRLGGNTGGSRSAGPSPFRHRKSLEDHFKLLQSVERVLVDASLYVSWLGESIEVHGQLTDAINSNQPVTVVQLGDGLGPVPK